MRGVWTTVYSGYIVDAEIDTEQIDIHCLTLHVRPHLRFTKQNHVFSDGFIRLASSLECGDLI
jgi:hypothetical protein